MPSPFLTAAWRDLVMLNYAIDPGLLAPLVPAGTELDAWDGTTYVSVVGFLFLDTRVLGLPIPFHRNFEEVNLRFYVRRMVDGETRRGVVFVKEIVPRPAIALTARLLYNEPYVSHPMRHSPRVASSPREISYGWRREGAWEQLGARIEGEPAPLAPGSEEEFITEHYWGYTRQRDGGTIEYRVEHPSWRVWRALDASLDADIPSLYGETFRATLAAPPRSAFVADGSPVAVHPGKRIR